jgi:hypothetical protein
MPKKNNGPLLHIAEGVFLQPATCGSAIHYSLTAHPGRKEKTRECDAWLEAEVTLRDCGRSITWYAESDPDLFIEKLNKAIETLTRVKERTRQAKFLIAADKAKKK